MKQELGRCKSCHNDMLLDTEVERSICQFCNASIIVKEAIVRRNTEIALMNAKERHYKEVKLQKAIASLICIVICVLCVLFLNPEIYARTQDTLISWVVTVIFALIACNLVFSFCTK